MIGGIDEAGRGSLAGPIVAAAVVLDLERIVGPDAAAFGRLDDSKRLCAAERDRLYDAVFARACAVSVAAASPATIDRDGLHRTNLAVMRRAAAALDCLPELILIDGFRVDGLPAPSRHIVRGDGTSAAVAAAAIVAKVTRDRLMHRLDAETGGRWGFVDHVGYGTPEHAERIQLHGVSFLHRRSYEAQAYIDAPEADLPPPGSRTIHHLRC